MAPATTATTPKGPTVSTLIAEAIENLKVKGSAKGVSRSAIKNYIGDRSTIARINLALKKMVAKGTVVQVKDSFKFPAGKKAVAEKKKTTKKATTGTKKPKATGTKKVAGTKKTAGTKKPKTTKKTTTKKATASPKAK
eukprot:m.177520 g.177520  ORF g.177520 m.177520 type:complete len:138 (-) comp16573_c0_seq2:4145-4558(-)